MKKILIILCCLLLILPMAASAQDAVAPLPDIAGLDASQLKELKIIINARLIALGEMYDDIKKGQKGENVTLLQERLIELGYLEDSATGVWDKNSIAAMKAYEKASGDTKPDGNATKAEQEAIFSKAAIAKPTPTPAPTPIPDEFVLEISKVKLKDLYNTKTFSIELKNLSADYTIDAFTVAHRVYDTYGDLLSGSLLNPGGIETAEWWKDLKLKPGGKFSMGSYYWYLFGDQTAARIEVAIMKYHTTDGKTIEIPEDKYLWVEGVL